MVALKPSASVSENWRTPGQKAVAMRWEIVTSMTSQVVVGIIPNTSKSPSEFRALYP
jgi:hypothetical protein